MYIIKSIIPFNLLVDTDMGLIKYIQFTSKDDIYYPGILELKGAEYTETLQYTLTHRNFFNPLSAIIKKDKMITCQPDKRLDIFLSKHYEEILKLSTSTALMDMVCKSLFVVDTLQFHILCNSELEKEELLRRFKVKYGTSKTPATIIIGDIPTVFTDDYGNVYVKDVHELDSYKPVLEGKNILIGNYNFNKEYNNEKEEYMNLPIVDVIQKYMSNNKISFIDVYPMNIQNSSVG